MADSDRILLFTTDLELGGTPTVVRELALRLRPHFAHVHVACLGQIGPVGEQIRSAGVTVTAFNLHRPRHLPAGVLRLRRLIRRERIDIVYSLLLHANAVAALASIRLPGLSGVRWFQSIQTVQPTPAWHWRLQRLAWRRAERVIVPSHAIVTAAARLARIPPGRCVVIPNAIDPAAFSQTAPPPRRDLRETPDDAQPPAPSTSPPGQSVTRFSTDPPPAPQVSAAHPTDVFAEAARDTPSVPLANTDDIDRFVPVRLGYLGRLDPYKDPQTLPAVLAELDRTDAAEQLERLERPDAPERPSQSQQPDPPNRSDSPGVAHAPPPSAAPQPVPSQSVPKQPATPADSTPQLVPSQPAPPQPATTPPATTPPAASADFSSQPATTPPAAPPDFPPPTDAPPTDALSPAAQPPALPPDSAPPTAAAPRLVLHFFGDGPARPMIESVQKSLRLGPARVVFHGSVPRPQIALRQIDILLLPSRVEGFGLVLIEAMAAGVAVVAINAGGVSDVVTHGHDGLLIDPADPRPAAAFARQIRRLTDDPPLRHRLTAAARATVATRFTWPAVIDQYLKVLADPRGKTARDRPTPRKNDSTNHRPQANRM